MISWDPTQYLQFETERTRPCRELVARIPLPAEEVRRAVDLGCGPGNSTEVLAARYPEAAITGVDSSADMLAEARARPLFRGPSGSGGGYTFEQADIQTWRPAAAVDVVLANASLQWIPDQAAYLPRLLTWLRPGGVLAVQMPRSYALPLLRLMEEVARDPAAPWAEDFRTFAAPTAVARPEDYYDWLAPHASWVDVTEVVYHHRMPGPEGVVAWAQGTGLRPWLAQAGPHGPAFLAEYARRVAAAYPRRADGRVLMEFRRLMLLIQR
jgi:trans-aconitate 2-methyltransferase